MSNNTLKLSNTLAKFIWAALLISALLLSACGGKDKKSKLDSEPKVLSASVLEFTAPPKRTVSEEEAEQALAAFGLGDGKLVDGVERSGKGGNYIYTKNTAKDVDFSFGAFEVIGLHMLGEIPMFDGIILRDVMTIDEESGVISSFEEVVFVGPSPMLCQMIADGIKAEKVSSEDEDIAAYFKGVIAQIDTLDLSAAEREARLIIGFESFSVSGISINGDGMNMAIEAVVLGKTKNGKGAGQIKNVNIKFMEIDGGPQGVLKLGLYEITDFNVEKFAMFANPDFYARVETEGFEDEVTEIMKAYIDPYNPHYDGYLIKDFSFSMEDLSIDMDQASLVSRRKGGVLTRVTTISPVTLKWPEQVADPELQEVIDAYARMGYDNMVISGGATSVLNAAQDTIEVRNYYLQFDDMFRLSGDISMEGVKMAFVKFVDIMGAEGFETMSDDEASEAMMKIFTAELKAFDFSLTFTDLSIVERSLKLSAEMLTEEGLGDMTPAMMKGKAKAAVSMLPMGAQDDAQLEYLTDMSKAMTSLIDNGGSITFSMHPNMPLDLEAIVANAENGEFDISILGLEVSAQGAKP